MKEGSDLLTPEQGQALLQLARQALETRIRQGKPISTTRLTEAVDARLSEKGATFVTLTTGGMLRGCIGTPEARVPLVEDVQENAVRAATMDPRFPPVSVEELHKLRIEVSILTPPRLLDCPPERRAQCVRPGIDGLLLVSGYARGLLLPQVWEKIPEPEEFLRSLCYKAGLSSSAWRQPGTELYTFQVQAFEEAE
jgi:AmmeMemoRadiSam system protein A